MNSKELVARLTTAFAEASPLEKWEMLALNGLLGTDEPWIENMRVALKEQEAHIAALDARIEALEGEPLDWEISWGIIDDDEGSPCAWRVHNRTGNVNDREWDLLATGETPLAAIEAALGGGNHGG